MVGDHSFCREVSTVRFKTLAAVDIGSNAARFLVSDVTNFSPETPIKKSAYLRIPMRLGADVFQYGAISEQRQTIFLETMCALSHLMRAYGVDGYRICATSAMRDAANGEELLDRVKRESGLSVEIISGIEEANILFEANVFSRYLNAAARALYVDVGGGSTEVIAINDGNRMESCSFQIGTVRMLLNAVTAEEQQRLRTEVQRMGKTWQPKHIIASGGNINKVAKLLDKREGQATDASEIQALYKALQALQVEERMQRYGLNAYRADVIVPALSIFMGIADLCGAKQFIIPKIGLADGIIRHMCLTAQKFA